MIRTLGSRAIIVGFLATAALSAVTMGALTQARADDPGKANRYPYDPVCSWGRIADGRGMMVRCMKQSEAEALLAGAAPPPIATPVPAPSSSDGSPGSEEEPPDTRKLSMEVGPVQVDSGTLPLALKKLQAPSDRYLECVEKHGGVTKSDGEVQVRFLVRERGRAEGAVVKLRRAVSEKAAACIADVVDRRFVGHPDVPIVGATLIVKFSKADR
jgi:hypothetical protein